MTSQICHRLHEFLEETFPPLKWVVSEGNDSNTLIIGRVPSNGIVMTGLTKDRILSEATSFVGPNYVVEVK